MHKKCYIFVTTILTLLVACDRIIYVYIRNRGEHSGQARISDKDGADTAAHEE